MAQRRTVDTSMLQGLVQGAVNQEVQRGNPKSVDSNFPAFKTPINEDILVYIPTNNMRVDETGSTLELLHSHLHDAKVGRNFMQYRCINGLSGGVYDALGYDGSCPACDGMSEVWELYNMKIDAIAKQLGVTPQNDPQEVLKPHREKILREEMDLKNSEEFVTFPVVVIPQKSKLVPADDAAQKMQVFFVTWRKKRYDEGIIQKALGSMLNNPGHPGGLFMLWQFTYETGGKEATVMQSARNAAYKVITEQQVLNTLEPLRSVAEAKAKPFDLVKASEVLVANQFMYKEDLAIEVDKVLKRTRQVLEAAQVKGVPSLNAGGTTPVGGNALQNFGFGQGTPQNLGTVPVGEPVIAGQPLGSPISFNG